MGNLGNGDELMGKVDPFGFLKLQDALQEKTFAMHAQVAIPDGNPSKDIKLSHRSQFNHRN